MDFLNRIFTKTSGDPVQAKKDLEAKQAQEKIDLETKHQNELAEADKAITAAAPPLGSGTAPIGGKRGKRTKRNRKSKKDRTGRRSNHL